MESLDWVDKTYAQKHGKPRGFSNLRRYEQSQTAYSVATTRFLQKSSRKAVLSISVFLLSFVPYVGKLVVPAVSFYTLNDKLGRSAGIAVFASGLVLPKRYIIVVLQSFFASRSLMRELLEPYFSRIKFTNEQKRAWYEDREAVLFGFGVGFFLLIKLPYIGVLVFGIAEASTAYLITKITDPPPIQPSDSFAQTQVKWHSKVDFLAEPQAPPPPDLKFTSRVYT